MDSLFTYWGTLIISIGCLVGAVWLWLGVGDWCREYWIFLRKAALINGPLAFPVIGNGLYCIGDPNEYLYKLIRLAETYTTPLRVWLGPKLLVIISDPSDIETLIKSPDGTYKSDEYRFIQRGTGPGLVTGSGPTHKIHRNLIIPMVNGKVVDEFIDSFEIQSRRCVECLESQVDSGEFDIKPFMDHWSMDIVLDTLIGIPGTVQQGRNTELMESAIKLNRLGYERLMKIWLYPEWIYSRTRSGKEYNKAVNVTRTFMNDIIAEKKKKYYDSKNSCDSSDPTQCALLDRLIAYNKEHKLMDDIRLRGEVFTMCIAAQEPPAITSSFMLLMLAMHPEIQDKVRAEVQEVIGDGNVTTRNVTQLKYLEMVIKETLRLFPAGVFLLRKATADIQFSSCTVPKGCSVAMFLFNTYRDPKLWKEPNTFNPERFSPENSVGRHPYAFVPFSGGIRGCIGKQYAVPMMKTLVTRILQKYRLHSNGSLENIRLACNVFPSLPDGYNLSITKI